MSFVVDGFTALLAGIGALYLVVCFFCGWWETTKAFLGIAIVGLVIWSISTIPKSECVETRKLTEADGVELWVYQPHCRGEGVYFSKSGTSRTIDHAKRSDEHIQVPNLEGK